MFEKNAELIKQFLQNKADFQQEVRSFINAQRAANDKTKSKYRFSSDAFENRIVSFTGLAAMDIPAIRPSVTPENILLPFLRSTEEIEHLTFPKVKLYLEAYDTPFDNSWSRRILKELLRSRLGFIGQRDLDVTMT